MPSKQFGGFNVKHLGEPANNLKADEARSGFQLAQIRTVHARRIREVLLRNAPGMTKAPKIRSKHVPQVDAGSKAGCWLLTHRFKATKMSTLQRWERAIENPEPHGERRYCLPRAVRDYSRHRRRVSVVATGNGYQSGICGSRAAIFAGAPSVSLDSWKRCNVGTAESVCLLHMDQFRLRRPVRPQRAAAGLPLQDALIAWRGSSRSSHS